MKFSGKGTVFDEHGKLKQLDGVHPAAMHYNLQGLILKAVVKNIGTRVVIGEEAFAATSKGKRISVGAKAGKDQNYLVITLKDEK